MSTIATTKAIAIRVLPYSKTSCIVVWLAPEHGRLTTLFKGAYRARSEILGQCDVFYTCDLLFYIREHGDLHIGRECRPIKTRDSFRQDWRSAACASFACDLVSKTIPANQAHPEIYDLLDSMLDFLAAQGSKPQILYWFEIRMLTLLGFVPPLDKCPGCGHGFGSIPAQTPLFSHAHGSILCHHCSRSRDGGQALPLPHDVMAGLRNWQAAESARSAQNTRCTPKQLLVLDRILGRLTQHHLDMVPASRSLALELVGGANASSSIEHFGDER